jgi:uncharacterized repeat protein (TIGR02543 family)
MLKTMFLNKGRRHINLRRIHKTFAAAVLLLALGYTGCEQPADDDPALPSYNVTFNANSGSPEPEAQTVVQGGKVVQPSAMTRPGYQFDGWYDTINHIAPAWDFDTNVVSADITLYARWITFNAVTDISGVAAAAVQDSPVILTGIITPSNATNKTITWTVKSGSANIGNGNRLTGNAAGTVVVTATIANGAAPGTAFSKDFSITIWEAEDPRVDFLGHWFGGRGTSGNPGYFDTDITISADKFTHLDGWGYYLDIVNLVWTAAVNSNAATQGQYPSGYTLTGTISRRNDDIFSGITSITIYIDSGKQGFLIPEFDSLNTASRYIKQ